MMHNLVQLVTVSVLGCDSPSPEPTSGDKAVCTVARSQGLQITDIHKQGSLPIAQAHPRAHPC